MAPPFRRDVHDRRRIVRYRRCVKPPHDGPDSPDHPVADTNAAPSVERRRPGRVEYTNQRLIALLRGKSAREDVPTAPATLSARRAGRAGSPGWPIVLLVLVIAVWATIGLLVWLAFRLL